MKKQSILTLTLLAAFALVALPDVGHSHCQVPCGIYDDHARVHAMLEDAETVVKASKQMTELAGKTSAQDANQMVRWVMNKESHAQNVIETIAHYFLTQRVKPSQEDYAERLQKHHAIIVAAMKAKQNADTESAEALVEAIKGIAAYYPKAN